MADLIVHNGAVFNANLQHPAAEASAAVNGKIVAVGKMKKYFFCNEPTQY